MDVISVDVIVGLRRMLIYADARAGARAACLRKI
jgi:hypothetical protein